MRQTAHVVEPARVRHAGCAERAARRRGGRRRRADDETGGGARRARRQGGLHGRTAAAAATRWPTPARPAAPGPDLDEVLADKDAAFIEQSIVDPAAEIAPGFSAGIMPPNFGETLQPAELDALVKYLDEVTGMMRGRR